MSSDQFGVLSVFIGIYDHLTVHLSPKLEVPNKKTVSFHFFLGMILLQLYLIDALFPFLCSMIKDLSKVLSRGTIDYTDVFIQQIILLI